MEKFEETLYNDNVLSENANSFKLNAVYRYQFLCKADVCRKNINYQNKYYSNTQTGNATILYANMVILGLSEIIAINERLIFKIGKQNHPFSKYHRSPTHHVIPIELQNNKVIKELHQIHLNDGRNGIILPHNKNSNYNFANGTPHCGSHPNYTNEVQRRITNCKNEDELWAIVDGLKWELYENKLKLN